MTNLNPSQTNDRERTFTAVIYIVLAFFPSLSFNGSLSWDTDGDAGGDRDITSVADANDGDGGR